MFVYFMSIFVGFTAANLIFRGSGTAKHLNYEERWLRAIENIINDFIAIMACYILVRLTIP